MNKPQSLQWDYDESPIGSESAFTTFSVGVYQWLPKTSGKGLKKSKTIRVKGYVAEPDRVYEKARQLCRKLNAERISSEKPPAWLQTQYAVAKPSGLVIERLSDDLTGNQVRSIRTNVMRKQLLPKGFVKSTRGTYVRKLGDQIHLINFQPAVFGHEYTVNLGFHYTFIPAAFARRSIKPADFQLLDCTFQARIGDFIGHGRDKWFAYGHDPNSLYLTLAQNAADCLQVFDRFAKTWGNPKQWVTSSVVLQPRPWRASYFELFIACVHMHLQQFEKAARMLKKLREGAEYEIDKRYYSRLLCQASSAIRGLP
jgi:hypothetical protein